MKKIFSLALVASIIIGFTACKKNTPSVENANTFGVTAPVVVPPPTPDPLAEIGAIPTTPGSSVFKFTKKSLLEEFTAEWCHACPSGAIVFNSVINASAGKVIGVATHINDAYSVPTYEAWISGLVGVSGIPGGSVDRGPAAGSGSWAGETATSLAKTAEVGIAMVTKTKNNIANIKLFIAYKNAIKAGTSLSVLITEDKVPLSAPGAQINSNPAIVIGPDYKHGHLLRGHVTKPEGQYIALGNQEKYTIVEFKDVDLTKMNISNLENTKVVAFVHYNNDTRDVLNVQDAGLNEVKKWD